MLFDPQEGVHYPGSTGDFLAWFSTDIDCLDYLTWLRWPNGFVCPTYDSTEGGWRLGDGRFMCSECGARTSVTAGTIFDRTRTPLTVWFHACWMLTTQKDGVSAQSLQRVLEIGTYKTAWAMLHRLRSALVRPGRERLTGEVEMDEPFVGGEEPGLRGGRQKGKKVLVGSAVERLHPKGFGRIRMAVLPDASTESLAAFLADHVEPGASLITDGWSAYPGATKDNYYHCPSSASPRSCPESTGRPRCSSGGCSAPTKAPSTTSTCPPTSTSSYSDSTAAPAAAAACSSSGHWRWPSPMNPCATATSCSARARRDAFPGPGDQAAIRPVWNERPPTDPGDNPSDLHSSG